jgi:catechol 2,3-dioxygenase-like lactoylglutathione lyase family enzyme
MSGCYCCGEDYPEDDLVRLVAHWEVGLCGGCIDSLVSRKGGALVRAVPVLATDDLARSTAFWTAAGFDVATYGDDFAAADRDGVELHLVEVRPAGRNRGEAYLHVRDVDRVHAEWKAAGLDVSEPRDEPWGMREFVVVDPGGNRVRVGRST